MKLKKIEFLKHKNAKYCDIATKNGNFVIGDNGVVVHNSHISALIVTALLKVIPGLFHHHKICRAIMPLYGVKKYQGKFLPFYSEDEMQEFKKKNPKIQITRYKGLGEMNPPELAECLLNPQVRKLEPIADCDAKEAEEIFKMMSDAEIKRDMLGANQEEE